MKILFVGNSYTYYNDMPKLFCALAQENGKDVLVDSVTKGGRKLYENLAPEDEYCQKIASLCRKNTYDVLILQEQSYFPLVDFEGFVKGLDGVMKLVNAPKTLFYATWGRKTGCPLLDELGMTSEEMTVHLAKAYQKAADILGAEISPVGACFCKLNKCAPEVELYNKDLSHPSLLGSTVAAITHYRCIFGELPKICKSLGLDSALESVLLQTAESGFLK